MTMAIERKVVPFGQIKFAEPDAGTDVTEMRFTGYGAAFGNVDSYGDVIEPGAFANTLAEAQKSGQFPSMLMQHGGWGIGADDMTPIGVWDKLAEDGKGLLSEGVLAPIQRGKEAYALMKMAPRPAITGLSIGYIAKKFTVRSKPDEPRRRLHEVDLLEISLVTFPANGKARISSVKSAGGEFTEREFEQLMQDAGLSRKEARVVMSHGFRHLKAMQDAGSTELEELAAAIKAQN
jgi:HK97 family phage prohead protease